MDSILKKWSTVETCIYVNECVANVVSVLSCIDGINGVTERLFIPQLLRCLGYAWVGDTTIDIRLL